MQSLCKMWIVASITALAVIAIKKDPYNENGVQINRGAALLGSSQNTFVLDEGKQEKQGNQEYSAPHTLNSSDQESIAPPSKAHRKLTGPGDPGYCTGASTNLNLLNTGVIASQSAGYTFGTNQGNLLANVGCDGVKQQR